MNRLVVAAIAASILTAAGAPAIGQTPARPAPAATIEYGFGADFWRGAPESVTERLGWLDMRVKSGIQNGSITQSEASRIHRMLHKTRSTQAKLLSQDNGQLSPRDSAYMQARLDNMSAQIHWARTNGVNRPN